MYKPINWILLLAILLCGRVALSQDYALYSPDSNIRINLSIDAQVSYSLFYQQGDLEKINMLIAPSPISLHTGKNGVFGKDAKVRSVKRNSVDRLQYPVVRQKSKEVPERYNELILNFKGNYALVFRAYNEGVAYRWESGIKDKITVVSEEVNFSFAGNPLIWFPEEESLFTHQEREYLQLPLEEINAMRFASPPVLVDPGNGPKMIISEADLQDYPGMYIKGSVQGNALSGMFPRVVVEGEQRNDRDVVPVERTDYIARTTGTRTFPWRVIGIAPEDKDLITNQMIFLLSEPCRIEDPSWIRPGKVSWDWWNDNNIYGVDFEAGINTQTYKHYIDFASEYGLDYIILDEGWYELGDLTAVNPEIDMQELLSYARGKGVGIILWVVWKTLDDQLEEVMPLFEEWGIAGLKVDFMQRDDQWMVNYYWRIAQEAAKRKFLVDFHGSYKPAGLHRTWPNVITREGVRGLEWNKWSDKATPDMAVTLPFIRMFAGPMDYTPGAMINATKEGFAAVFSTPMSQGTRAHQLAMYVVFESPLQMLADNPSHYREEPECMQFLADVPVEWDETIVLDAKVGEYIVLARRHGHEWYLGGMSGWDSREVEITLDFLGERKFSITMWKDGPNAHRAAKDFVKEEMIVDKHSTLRIKMAPGGGFAAILGVVRL